MVRIHATLRLAMTARAALLLRSRLCVSSSDERRRSAAHLFDQITDTSVRSTAF